MKQTQNTTCPGPYHIIVLDHHLKNDQRINRHIEYCKKKQIPVDRIRLILHHKAPGHETEKAGNEHQLKSPIMFKGGTFNYALVHLSTFLSPWVWYNLLKFVRKIVQIEGSHIIFHVHDPFLLIFGVVLKVFRYNSSYIIYDRHEYYEEMRGIGKYCEKLSGSFIDGVVLVTDSQVQSTKKQLPGVDHMVVVPNYPDVDNRYTDRIYEKISAVSGSDRINFVYIGSLSTKVDRDIYGMMDICSALLKKFNNVHITIGGTTSEKELLGRFNILTSMYPGRFIFAGYLNRDEVVYHTSNAHFGFFLLDERSPYWVSCSPNKIFDYLLFGVVPIIRANIDEKENLQRCSLLYGREDSLGKIIQDIGYYIENRELIQNYMKEAINLSQLYSFESVEDRYSLLYNLVCRNKEN
jgi:hypothetical protein